VLRPRKPMISLAISHVYCLVLALLNDLAIHRASLMQPFTILVGSQGYLDLISAIESSMQRLQGGSIPERVVH